MYLHTLVLFLWTTLTNPTEVMTMEIQRSEHILGEETVGLRETNCN